MRFPKSLAIKLVCLAIPVAVALGTPTTAQAMTVDEVMNMIEVSVPTPIVVATMAGSGTRFTADDVKVLRDRGAPAEVIAQAEKMGGGSGGGDAAPGGGPTPAPDPVAEDPLTSTPGATFEAAESLSGDIGDVEEPAATGGPAELQQAIEAQRTNRHLTASKALYDLLASGRYPEHETRILYHLAKSLYGMGLYHGAQHYYMEVVRRGTNTPFFKYALPKLVDVAEYTGNDVELLRIVHKIPPEAFPRRAKDHLHYLMGRKFYETEDLTDSAEYFRQISQKSDLYMRSKYFEGVINNERGKLRSAVMAFREVMEAQPPITGSVRKAEEIEDLKDLALINVGRIYFSLERFDNADNYYSMVQRESTYWPESLFERAWTNFWKQDLNLTLGLLLTVESPYFATEEFIPEVIVLRALTFFTLCEYDQVESILVDFENDYKPMAREMERFLEQYKTEENRQLADQAYDAYFTAAHKQSVLHRAMFTRVLRNRELSALVRHMDMMDAEIVSIDEKKGVWKDTLGDELKKVIAADRQRYKKRAGLLLLRELEAQKAIIEDLIAQSEIVRFEVVDAQRQDYEFKMRNPDVDSFEDKKIDFATSKDTIYWPFNGEFWSDELGYYRYTEHGSCK